MASIHSAVLDLKRLDLLANGDSTIHRLDARAKVLVTLVFIISVVSFTRYELSALFPFFVFPVVMISLAGLPPRFILGKIILICPFVLAVGLERPWPGELQHLSIAAQAPAENRLRGCQPERVGV